MKSAAQKKLKTHVTRCGHCDLEVTEHLAHYWFTVINKAVFKDQLPRPNIVIRPMRKYRGWAHAKTGRNLMELANDPINKNEFISLIAHEMVHLWQWQTYKSMNHGQTFLYWKKFFKKHYNLSL